MKIEFYYKDTGEVVKSPYDLHVDCFGVVYSFSIKDWDGCYDCTRRDDIDWRGVPNETH